MSYARFGCDGSDVYVFVSDRAIECCGCWLQKREWTDDPGAPFGGWLIPVGEIVETDFTSNEDMIAHLEVHRAAGHTVPEYVFERLRDPKDVAANRRIWKKYAVAR